MNYLELETIFNKNQGLIFVDLCEASATTKTKSSAIILISISVVALNNKNNQS